MANLLPIPRFPLPDDWEPEGVMCVLVRIPDDPQYLSALTGLIDLLRWSDSFDRDPTKTGAATVARTWRAALDNQPIETKGCDMPDFRINEETCLLEVNCSDDPDSPDWQPVQTPAYDPRTDQPVTNPYPDPVTGEYIPCLAAANATEYIKYVLNTFTAMVGSSEILGIFVAAIFGLVQQVITLGQALIYESIIIDLPNYNASTIVADYDAFDWDELKNLLVCYYDAHGKMNAAKYLELLGVLEDKWGDSQIWRAISLACDFLGPVGLTMAARWAGIVDADCEDCAWCHTFDFTTGEHGWFAVDESLGHGSLPSATYVAGSGWKPNASNIPDRIRVELNLPSGTMINKFTGHLSTVMTGDARWSQLFSAGGLWQQIVPEDDTTSEFTFTAVNFSPQINWALDNDSADAPFLFYITSIELCGVGAEPEWV